MYAAPVVEQYRLMLRLQQAAVRLGSKAWSRVRVEDLGGSWATEVARFMPLMVSAQLDAAVAGATYVGAALEDAGEYVAPSAAVQPRALVGVASDGRPLDSLLYSPVTGVKTLIGQGTTPAEALRVGGALLERNIRTTLADTARTAAGVDVASRVGVGYVRMLNPPSCSRCTLLAGRFYRWNSGFQRHPRCDCIHQPSKGAEAALSEGLIRDPYEYFNGLTEQEQDRTFTKAGARAIRDGADISQVVNARRGMTAAGTTTEGTTKRGNYGRNKPPRLMPEQIYKIAGTRENALRMLRQYGYILPQGQVLAPIRGEGFGFTGGRKNRLGL